MPREETDFGFNIVRAVDKAREEKHAEAVKTIDCLYEDYLELRELALDMGRLIRRMDEANEHSEFWTMDEDYIIDARFPR